MRGKGAEQAPKMIILNKVDEMCSDKREEPVEPLSKDDTDVMWNEFLRFRQKIKYNMMTTVLCCCTRKQRAKSNSALYNQLLLKSSEEKLSKALDVRSIMRTNKYLKLLMHAILTKKGRYLIRNQ